MSGFETRFGAEDDAGRIRAAFYGFVGRHAAAADDEAMAAFLSGLDRPGRRRRRE